jgi:hypothetical protein
MREKEEEEEQIDHVPLGEQYTESLSTFKKTSVNPSCPIHNCRDEFKLNCRRLDVDFRVTLLTRNSFVSTPKLL